MFHQWLLSASDALIKCVEGQETYYVNACDCDSANVPQLITPLLKVHLLNECMLDLTPFKRPHAL
jgi:hypothetical protein